MKKINIAEILKDCPKGMELDCLMFDNVVFEGVDQDECYPIKVKIKEHPITLSLTKYGCWNLYNSAKCIIFPKGKTTWEGFVPPCEFKDGDIVATSDGRWIGITIGGKCNCFMPTYCIIKGDGEFEVYLNKKETWQFYRLATEEEKAKLFQTIKDNGYKWNAETKTLEKLPKFKEGDVAISDLGDIHLLRTEDSSYCAYRMRWTGATKLDNTITTSVKVARLATEEEKQILFDSIKANGYKWNEETKTLEKLINKYKFVIGAIITNGKIKGKISLRDGDSYVLEDNTHVFFSEVHNWELVPSKFDINTLKPFDKVLVRHNKDNKWCCSFFSHIDKDLHSHCYKFVTTAGKSYPHCIPYEGNQKLRGTTNDCDEYFKNW